MTTRPEKSVACFKEGFSCSQAVFSAFAEEEGLDRTAALKIAQPFGGGLAHRGEICGAVFGALLAIGLKHGRIRVEDLEARDRTYRLVNELMDRFRAAHGSLDCPTLLGAHIGTPDGMAAAKARNLFQTVCPQYVRTAAVLLEDIL
jgi:C_GCAxxG_C_C family probable redox protein